MQYQSKGHWTSLEKMTAKRTIFSITQLNKPKKIKVTSDQ